MDGLKTRAVRLVEGLDDRRTAALILLAAGAVYALVVVVVGRGEQIFVDERDYFYVDRGLDAYALLTPLNGHLVVFPASSTQRTSRSSVASSSARG